MEDCTVWICDDEPQQTDFKLLCGFLDPTEGAVLLNGQDIRTLDRRQYYELFGAVFQKVSVLPATVAENVSQQTAEEGAMDRGRVADCLRRAGLEKTVAALPDGMDTLLGREVYLEATQLSGGQEQRLMLARALHDSIMQMDNWNSWGLRHLLYRLRDGFAGLFRILGALALCVSLFVSRVTISGWGRLDSPLVGLGLLAVLPGIVLLSRIRTSRTAKLPGFTPSPCPTVPLPLSQPSPTSTARRRA